MAAPTPASEDLERLLEAGDLDAAIRAGESAVAREELSSTGWDLLGRAYGLKAKESFLFAQFRLARKARACFQKAVTLDPSNVSARADLATYDMRAPAFLGGGKEKARRQIEEVASLDAARGHELRGALAEVEKHFAAAETQYRLALQASMSAPLRARRALSGFYVRRRRFAPARQIWLDALAADSADGCARYELAGVALESGEGVDEAQRELQSLLQAPETAGGVAPEKIEERLAELKALRGAPAGTGRAAGRQR